MVARTSGGPGASLSSQSRASIIAVSSPVLLVSDSAPTHRTSAVWMQAGPNNSTCGEGEVEDSSQTATPPRAEVFEG